MLKSLWRKFHSLGAAARRRLRSGSSDGDLKRFCRLQAKQLQVAREESLSRANNSNEAEATTEATTAVEPSVSGSEKRPLPNERTGYAPIRYTPIVELPVYYWFYVYLYSSECDRLLAPFVQLSREDLPRDRRLVCIMNRCKVRIFLSSMELYKSLPRHILVVQGVDWQAIIHTLVELEGVFPQVMRFATYPLLVSAATCRFSCTSYRQSALQTRLTR